jgi:hypothetical protein
MTGDSKLTAELAAIKERNEALRSRYGYVGGLLVLAKAQHDIPRLVKAVEAALAEHRPDSGEPGWCNCGFASPCSTVRAITRELTGQGADDAER